MIATLRRRWPDVLPPAVLGALAVLSALTSGGDDGIQFDTGQPTHRSPLLVLAVAALLLPLLARRREPGLVLLLVTGAFAARHALGLVSSPADFALFVAVYSCGRHARRRRDGAAVAAYAVFPLVRLATSAEERAQDSIAGIVALYLVFLVVPLGCGLVARAAAERRPAAVAAGPPPDADEPVALTGREAEVLVLAAQGLSNPEIAVRLVVSPETVKSHLGRAMAKLGARNRTQAVLRARDLGLIDV